MVHVFIQVSIHMNSSFTRAVSHYIDNGMETKWQRPGLKFTDKNDEEKSI